MGYLKFASVAVAITAAAIAPAIFGKTSNAAPPNAVSAEIGSAAASARAPTIRLAKLEGSPRENAGSSPHFQSEAAIAGDAMPPRVAAAAEVGPQPPAEPMLSDIPLSDAETGVGQGEDTKTADSQAATSPNATSAEVPTLGIAPGNAGDGNFRYQVASAEAGADVPSMPSRASTGREAAVAAVPAKLEQTEPEQAAADTSRHEASFPNKLAAAAIASESASDEPPTATSSDSAPESGKSEQALPEVYTTASIGPATQDTSAAQEERAETALPAAPSDSDITGSSAARTEQAAGVRQAKLEEGVSSLQDNSTPALAPEQLSYLAYYPYAEIMPKETPAQMALDKLKGISVGSPLDEIKRAARAFGLDFNFMKAVAKVESDFDPRQRTGSYIGLFQLSHYEFKKYGSGEITNARDNAVAAAYKFITEATLFELDTHRNPTYSDLYLIHQQGWQGAAEHVAHPDRIAWKSMCATDEGKEKGEKWCKRAVWQNTLPAIKHVWKSVENMTSGAFVAMWRQRIDRLYARYANRTEK